MRHASRPRRPAHLLVVDPAAQLANEEQPAAVTAALLDHLLAGAA